MKTDGNKYFKYPFKYGEQLQAYICVTRVLNVFIVEQFQFIWEYNNVTCDSFHQRIQHFWKLGNIYQLSATIDKYKSHLIVQIILYICIY